MDEYLFIALAKLKADRRKLEREQRAALPVEPATDEERAAARDPTATRWFSRHRESRAQS